MTAEFAGQTALVTGAITGIGRVVAGQLAAGGAHVVISGRDRSRLGQETVLPKVRPRHAGPTHGMRSHQ